MNNNNAQKEDTHKENKLYEEKYLISVYISAKTAEKIDDCMFGMKKRMPMDKRRKLTKSIFCEIGLRLAVEEYNRTGEESPLWKEIANLLND